MNTKAIGWAPANPWFESGFASRVNIVLEDQTIQVLKLSYFLATKFAAFNDRGVHDPRTSHDFEDIVYILDNQLDLVEQIVESPEDVKWFLKSEIESILNDSCKLEAIYGNLYYLTREERYLIILEKLKKIVEDI